MNLLAEQHEAASDEVFVDDDVKVENIEADEKVKTELEPTLRSSSNHSLAKQKKTKHKPVEDYQEYFLQSMSYYAMLIVSFFFQQYVSAVRQEIHREKKNPASYQASAHKN